MTVEGRPGQEQQSPWLGYVITCLAVAMSGYHLMIAWTGGYEALYQRSLSYLFGATLIFLVYPGRMRWERRLSLALAVIAFALLFYTVEESWRFVRRLKYIKPLPMIDVVVGSAVILMTLEVTRRTINNALPIIAFVFLFYTLFGSWFPWDFAHKGATYVHMIELQYTTNEGLWSTPLNTFSVYIFLFILFGTFLDRMGAAEIYVRLAFALTGRSRGGPAKAAIFASGMTGSITGSANANVVTTGSFTIPMMKRAGFKPEIAAGVETAASTGGQIMPPVMGAAAFLIVEFTGISYWEIVKVSLLPAALYFLAVFLMVHLEACKNNLSGLPRDEVPRVWPIMKEGGIFLIPPALIFIMVMDRWSVPMAGLAGIASVVVLAALKGAWQLAMRSLADGFKTDDAVQTARRGVVNVIGALDRGARQSLPICAAVAAVGLIIGALFQTGLGIKFSSIVISASQGNLLLGILLVGIASFVLGMGLPTTAAYIVLSVMAVPALLNLGEPFGITVLTAHLIVFWYSLDSNFTPPVCVPAYTAAGIAAANPAKAAWAAFRYAKGMYVIPLLFAYTPILMLDQPLAVAETFIAAVFGFIALGAVLVGYLLAPLNNIDRALLSAAALCLFWPMPEVHVGGAAILVVAFLWQRSRLARLAQPGE